MITHTAAGNIVDRHGSTPLGHCPCGEVATDRVLARENGTHYFVNLCGDCAELAHMILSRP